MRLFLSFLFLLSFLNIYSQKVNGNILDENKNPLEYASILLLQKSDSSMVSFTNSDKQGLFTIEAQKAGEYILQITYLGYENYTTAFKMESALDLGIISMKPGSQVLDEIVVKEYASPITFGKDTLQYNAAAFKIKPGDMAEDLLKKLPGVEVQRDGSIKALGEKVDQVFVDGKEFFGKDTKIATKNIDADAIDKVQVFDKKSARSEFTEIDDGQRQRSINFKLKEGKKVGYFGTTEVASGDKDRFKARANLNRFTPNLRSSFIGMANNINEQNFSLNEYIDFMGGIGAMMGGGSGRFTLNVDEGSGLPLGLDNNQGIQKSLAGGLNISKDFSRNTSIESSFFGNHFNNLLEKNSTRENLFGNTNFLTSSNENQNSKNNSGNFTSTLKSKIDSSQNLVLRVNGSLGNSFLNSKESNELFNNSSIRQNSNENDYLLDGNNHRISADLLWQQKLKKKGRTISLNGAANVSDQKSNGELNSIYNFYQPINGADKIIQDQLAANSGLFYKAEASYTEPLQKKRYLEFKSTFANQSNKTSNDYFDIINENSIKNQLLSTLYQRDYSQIYNGLSYIMTRPKSNLTIGAKYKQSTLLGEVNNENNQIKNKFKAFLPNAFYSYRMGMAQNLNFNYISELNEPSIQQLQPVVNNSNPLAIYRGNPNLRAEQMHNANLSYMKYDGFNFRMLYASMQANYTHNKIIEGLSIDSNFVRSYSPINVKNELTTSSRLEYETPIKPLKVKARMVLKGNYNRGFSIINDVTNSINRYGYGYNFSLENRNKDVIDLLVGYKSNNSKTNFQAQSLLNQSYTENTLYIDGSLNIKDKVTIKTNFDYMIIKPSFAEKAVTFPLWTASISTFVTKDKRFRATFSAYDILNQNKGIRTSSNLNYTDISRSNVLNRYFLLGLSYNIKGFQKKSGIEISTGGRD